MSVRVDTERGGVSTMIDESGRQLARIAVDAVEFSHGYLAYFRAFFAAEPTIRRLPRDTNIKDLVDAYNAEVERLLREAEII
jgi:hypothetical protein